MKVPVNNNGVIAQELRRRDLSDRKGAFALGISPQYLCDVLAGRRRLSVRLAARMERVLGIDGFALLVGDLRLKYESALAVTTGERAMVAGPGSVPEGEAVERKEGGE